MQEEKPNIEELDFSKSFGRCKAKKPLRFRTIIRELDLNQDNDYLFFFGFHNQGRFFFVSVILRNEELYNKVHSSHLRHSRKKDISGSISPKRPNCRGLDPHSSKHFKYGAITAIASGKVKSSVSNSE